MENGKGCATIDGKCAFHDVEIERRRHGDRHVDELKTMVEEQSEDIGRLYSKDSLKQTFIGQAKIVGVVATLVYSASFMYTYVCNKNLVHDVEKIHERYVMIERRVDMVEGHQLVNNEKFSQLMGKIDILTKQIEKLIVK